MSQPTVPPVRFEGPFLGLNTTHDPRQVGPQWATEAHNVMLSDGRVRPRAPFRGLVPDPLTRDGYYVIGMFHWDRGENFSGGQASAVVVVTVSRILGRVRVFVYQRTGVGGDIDRFEAFVGSGGFTDDFFAPAQFHLVRGALYVFAGTDRIVMHTQGDQPLDVGSVYRVGLVPPVVRQGPPTENGTAALWVHGTIDVASGTGLGFRASYVVTVERRLPAVVRSESNPAGGGTFVATDSQGVRFEVVAVAEPDEQQLGITNINVYRQNGDLGFPFYRLVKTFVPNVAEIWDDTLQEDDVFASSIETGPWSPSLNGLPPGRAVGSAYHQGRMWYIDQARPGRLFYSNIDRPGEVGGDNFIDLGEGFTDKITSLGVLSGQLAIGGEDGISILTGTVGGPTNETVSVGAPPIASSFRIYSTRSSVGPVAVHSFILAGEPSLLFFPHWSGFYAFDGQNSWMVSNLIKPTWREFVGGGSGADSRMRVTYGVDPLGQVIWMANRGRFGASAAEVLSTPVLLYHYGVNRGDGKGIWATASLGEHELPNEDGLADAITVVAGYGFNEEVERAAQSLYAPVLVGTARGMAAAMLFGSQVDADGPPPEEGDTAPADPPMPEFRYLTGQMPIQEGFDNHVYHLDFFYADAPVEGSMQGAIARFGYVDANGDEDTQVQDMTDPGTLKKRVGESLRAIQVVFEKSDLWETGWHPRLGFIGWAADIERIGQR